MYYYLRSFQNYNKHTLYVYVCAYVCIYGTYVVCLCCKAYEKQKENTSYGAEELYSSSGIQS